MSSTREKKGGDLTANAVRAAEVFAQHGDFIRRVIRYRVGDDDLVDEVFQDFFLSLVANPIPQNVRCVRGYIYRAILNDGMDAVRRVGEYHDRIKRYAKSGENGVNKCHPGNALIETEEAEKMFKTIERLLPARESRAVTLRFRDRCSVGEVAARMAVTRRSVSRYISAGLNKLRRLLAGKEGA